MHMTHVRRAPMYDHDRFHDDDTQYQVVFANKQEMELFLARNPELMEVQPAVPFRGRVFIDPEADYWVEIKPGLFRCWESLEYRWHPNTQEQGLVEILGDYEDVYEITGQRSSWPWEGGK